MAVIKFYIFQMAQYQASLQQYQQLQQQQNYQHYHQQFMRQQQGAHLESAEHQQQGAPKERGREGRQPLYANAPPKPRRLNTSRDYSPESADNSPDRNNAEVGDLSADDFATSPSQEYRHRLPQERRTPEAYGRSNPRISAQQLNQSRRSTSEVPHTQLEYEDVYNTSYNTTGYSEELANYARNISAAASSAERRASGQQQSTQNRSRPKSEHIPTSSGHGLPLNQNEVSGNVPSGPDRVPRPHSADFLEYERNYQRHSETAVNSGQTAATGIAAKRENNRRHSQPPRPKSSIGEIR